jgi:uncharacterized membrane protein
MNRNRYTLAASALGAAVGMALALQAPVRAADDTSQAMKANAMKAPNSQLQKCYGVNAVSKNDCAAGAHSCAGQATMARDPASFVLLPAGVCSKIAGGSTTAKGS